MMLCEVDAIHSQIYEKTREKISDIAFGNLMLIGPCIIVIVEE